MTTAEEQALRAEATAAGLDPDKAVAAAKSIENSQAPKSSAAPADAPKLFQYHLPFVTVREVRNTWLGLTEPFPGDDQVASDWAAAHAGGGASGGGSSA